jgi:predicted transcriptional regulator
MPAPNPISPKRRAAAVRLYKRLQSIKAVAETLGMATASVGRFVKAAGILRGRGRPRIQTPSLEYLRVMQRLYGSTQDVADILGCSRATVYNRLSGKGER